MIYLLIGSLAIFYIVIGIGTRNLIDIVMEEDRAWVILLWPLILLACARAEK